MLIHQKKMKGKKVNYICFQCSNSVECKLDLIWIYCLNFVSYSLKILGVGCQIASF